MTIEGPAAPRACPNCGTGVEEGDRFCERCGHPLTTPPVADEHPRTPDDATRLLCASTHLDDEFCRQVITEHLTEPTRQIPPTPGVDVVAVLRDAVSARRRRRIRDGTLLALLVLCLLSNPLATLNWASTAFVIRAVLPRRRLVRRLLDLAAGAVLNGGAVLAVVAVLLVAGQSGRSWFPTLWSLLLPALNVFWIAFAALAVLVLVADALLVDGLVRTEFRPGSFRADADTLPAGLHRTLRTCGVAGFRSALDRVARAQRRARSADEADVLVFRGDHPFVGAGVVDGDEAITVPLEPRSPDTVPSPVTTEGLYGAVASAVRDLHTAESLAPSGRLCGIHARDVVIVPARRLVSTLPRQPVPPLLASLDHAPVPAYPLEAARRLAERPQEWARYYRCFRVEAWDRDLAVTTWFSAGIDPRMLHLETVCTVLTPLDDRFHQADRVPSVPVLLGALGRAVMLPTTVRRRIRSVTRRFRPARRQPGRVLPEAYGAGPTLREVAARPARGDFFQSADVVRYEQVVRTTVLHAVYRYLEDLGYAAADLDGRARRAAANPITLVDNRFGGVSVVARDVGAPLAVGTTVTQSVHDRPKEQS